MKINQKLTDKIIKIITENPELTWQALYKKQSTLLNAKTGKRYRGGNEFLLLAQLMDSPYKSGLFVTFKQGQELKLKMIKGSKSFIVNFFKFMYKSDDKIVTSSDDWNSKFPITKTYNVFSLDCFEDSPEKQALLTKYAPSKNDNQPIESVQAFIDSYLSNENIPVKISPSLTPCYIPGTDSIGLPMLEQYLNSPAYYSVFFHEIAHSTGHTKRLNRDLSGKFGGEKYAKEELIAELTAAQFCNSFNIEGTIDNSAAYLKSWLKALQNDPAFIITAASKASKAMEYITKSVDTFDAKNFEAQAA